MYFPGFLRLSSITTVVVLGMQLMNCLDTDILVDCLRGLQPAIEWLAGAGEASFDPSVSVAMALNVEACDKKGLTETRAHLSMSNRIWPDEAEMVQACDFHKTFRFTAGLSIFDRIIATMMIRRSTGLLTNVTTSTSNFFESLPT